MGGRSATTATLRQLDYRERLRQRDELRYSFSSQDELVRLVSQIQFRRPDEVAPRKPQNLPYESLGTLFKGRDEFLRALHERLAGEPGSVAAVTARQAIHGLGGIGKTRCAIEYAWQHEADYTALLFVTADSPENLRRNLAELCGPLVLDLTEKDAKEEEVRVAAALRWLEQHPGWFLILDNVDTPDAAAEVEKLLSRLRRGHVLITSRLADWSAAVEPLELDVLSEEASRTFLLERTEGRRRVQPDDERVAVELARTLDGLALALEQAGAYVCQRRISLSAYLERWRSQEPRVREWHDERLLKYPRSLAVTWETTLEQLGDEAMALLRMLCWLAPEPIPAEMLAGEQAAAVFAEAVAGPEGDTKHGLADTDEALAQLASFSFLKWGTEGTDQSLFQIHRLVQEITRGRITEAERRFWIERALQVVNAYAPADSSDVRTWPVWEPLRPHVAAIVTCADEARIIFLASRLIRSLGSFLTEKCLWDEAERCYRRVLAADQQRLGPDHPDVATDFNNLALLLHATNRLSEAEPLMRRVVEIMERSLGADHPNVASALNNLAMLLQTTNRQAEAELLYRRALVIDEQTLGADYPNVARDLNNLAQLLLDENRLVEAESLIRRALAIDEESWGPDHPNVATDLNSLVLLLHAANRLSEAEPIAQRVVEIMEENFGAAHPKVAIALNNHAQLLEATERRAEAELLYRRALSIDEQSLGRDHPSVAIRLNNLAQLLKATNRLAEAEPLMLRQLEIFLEFTRITGREHPFLRAAIGNYSSLLRAMGRSPKDVRAQLGALGPAYGIEFADIME